MERATLFAEIRRNRAVNVSHLLESGEQVNQIDLVGWTPLHHAAFLGHAKVGEVLLEHGAEINAGDRDGLTPLHLAVANANVKMVSVLIKHGANPLIADRFGRYPADVSTPKTAPLLPPRPEILANPTVMLPSSSLARSGLVDRNWAPVPDEDIVDPAPAMELHHRNNAMSTSSQMANSPFIASSRFASSPVPPSSLTSSRRDSLGSSSRLDEDSGEYSSSGSESPNRNPAAGAQGSSTLKQNMQKIWLKTKQVAKWQIISILVRILLCYLLELFVDHLKRVLQFVVITYSPYDVIVLLFQPLQMILSPIWPLIEPLLTPIGSFLSSITLPVVQVLTPLFNFVWAIVSPLFSMIYQLGWFILDKLQYFVIPIQRLIWDPLVRIATALYSVIGPSLGWIYTTFIHPFIGVIGRILVALFSPLFYILQRIAGVLLQPLWLLLQKIGLAIFAFCVNNYQKIMENVWKAIQPMLNIRGFFSRVFGPLITGLKAVMHWFVPESILRPIDRMAVVIFGREHGQDPNTQTEETALMVVSVFMMLVYGSVIIWGYAFKLFLAILFLYDDNLANRVSDRLSVFFLHNELDTEQISISWILPDFWHHHIGMLLFIAMVLLILVFRLGQFIAWGTPRLGWLIIRGIWTLNTKIRQRFSKRGQAVQNIPNGEAPDATTASSSAPSSPALQREDTTVLSGSSPFTSVRSPSPLRNAASQEIAGELEGGTELRRRRSINMAPRRLDSSFNNADYISSPSIVSPLRQSNGAAGIARLSLPATPVTKD